MATRSESSAATCKHGYPVNDADPTVQECIDSEASAAAQGRRWKALGFRVLLRSLHKPSKLTVEIHIAWGRRYLRVER
jgi:hypothetical protein